MKVLFLNGPGFDYLTSQLCEGFHFLHQQGAVDFKCLEALTHHGAQVEQLDETPLEEALDLVDESDIVMFASAGNMMNPDEQVQELLKDKSITHKRVFVDGHDGDGFLVDPKEQLVYFKRELRYPGLSRMITPNVRGLTFGVYNFLMDAKKFTTSLEDDWNSRDIDISFVAFGGSNPVRMASVQVFDEIRNKLGWKVECHVDDGKQPLPLDEYHDIIYRSKISVSLPGAGLDTLRFWEIPGHGAVLFSMDLSTNLYIRHGFEQNRHCVYFTNWKGMVESAGLVVNDMDRWMQMRGACDAHLEYHTTEKRARQVLEICMEMM